MSNERAPLLSKQVVSSTLRTPAELSKRERPWPAILASSSGLTFTPGWITVTAVWIGVFIGALDGTIAATLVTSISSEFGASQNAGWLGTSYLLSTACVTPLYGKMCDIIGRRWSNLTALALFTFGTLGCGLATSMEMMIAARLLAGCGGGGMMSTSSYGSHSPSYSVNDGRTASSLAIWCHRSNADWCAFTLTAASSRTERYQTRRGQRLLRRACRGRRS
jgi:hypothetical protein